MYEQINAHKRAFDNPIYQGSVHIEHETVEAIVDGAIAAFNDNIYFFRDSEERKNGPTLTLLK